MAEKPTVQQELADLHLEKARFEVSNLRSEENMRKVRARAVQSSLDAQAKREADVAAYCAHKKGGKGLEMLHRGNDHNYAVVKHQLPHGPIIVVCQRCPKVWAPPDPALIARGASTEDRKEYARLSAEYRTALDFPTDNEMSGSQLFLITPAAA